MNFQQEIEFYKIKWDFFITHSSKDEASALELYNILSKNSIVFLDKISIGAGERWDDIIDNAQKESLITIVLISVNIDTAYYARDEVHTAIMLTRKRPNTHKIIPIYLNDLSEETNMLYGLRLIQGLSIKKNKTFENIADSLQNVLSQFKSANSSAYTEPSTLKHPLFSYPTGPLVESNLIPRSLIDMYANLIKESEAKLVVSEANAFRLEANPGITYIIAHNRIPSPNTISAFEYWMDVFGYACLQGPRMLAALLLVVPDDLFNENAKAARTKLLNTLKNY
jgi:hypothetical protein